MVSLFLCLGISLPRLSVVETKIHQEIMISPWLCMKIHALAIPSATVTNQSQWLNDVTRFWEFPASDVRCCFRLWEQNSITRQLYLTSPRPEPSTRSTGSSTASSNSKSWVKLLSKKINKKWFQDLHRTDPFDYSFFEKSWLMFLLE